MIKKIVIITGQHLINNPRVWKEANTLCESGYDVTIFTTWYSSKYSQEDKILLNSSIVYLPSFSLIPTLSNIFTIFYARAVKKFANFIFVFLKISSVYQLLYMPKRQIKCIGSRASDLFICHQEAGLLLGIELLKAGYKVAFDFEDWYSEDYLKRDRPLRLLQEAELKAIRYGSYITCPSHSMAGRLIEKCKVEKSIQVIFNSFQYMNKHFIEQSKIPNSIVWFSQTIGPDRGLESFLEAVQSLNIPLQIHLIGNSSHAFQEQLLQLINNTLHVIKFHSMMSHYNLINFLSNFEIGLALETNCSQSRVHTITNKIITYLQLNLNVIASDTIGQLELQADFKESITYVSLDDPIDLVRKLHDVLLCKKKRKSIAIPYKYTWEAQQKKILTLVSNSICA